MAVRLSPAPRQAGATGSSSESMAERMAGKPLAALAARVWPLLRPPTACSPPLLPLLRGRLPLRRGLPALRRRQGRPRLKVVPGRGCLANLRQLLLQALHGGPAARGSRRCSKTAPACLWNQSTGRNLADHVGLTMGAPGRQGQCRIRASRTCPSLPGMRLGPLPPEGEDAVGLG